MHFVFVYRTAAVIYVGEGFRFSPDTGHPALCTHEPQPGSSTGTSVRHRGHRSTNGFVISNLHCGQRRASDLSCSSSERTFCEPPGRAIMDYIRICESIPPMRNAPNQVPDQISSESFNPRSLSMTINDAMQGTNSVMVTRATTI